MGLLDAAAGGVSQGVEFGAVQADAAVGWVEDDVGAGDDEVAGCGESDAAGGCVASDCGDGGDVAGGELVEEVLDYVVDAVNVDLGLLGGI